MSPSTTLDTICAPSDDVVAREIEGEIVIVPLTAGIGDAEVVASLMEEYESDQGELEADVVGFAGELVQRGILTDRS